MPNNTVSIQLMGQKQLIAKFKHLTTRVKIDLKDAVNDSALAIMTNAKKRLRDWPAVDTGRLRASIRVEFLNMGIAAEVGTNVEYGAFVEYGTGQRGSATLPSGVPLPHGYVHGSKNGMRARPYLWPAYFAEEKNFKRAIKMLLIKEGKKLRGER